MKIVRITNNNNGNSWKAQCNNNDTVACILMREIPNINLQEWCIRMNGKYVDTLSIVPDQASILITSRNLIP